jgi:hypothetical protein
VNDSTDLPQPHPSVDRGHDNAGSSGGSGDSAALDVDARFLAFGDDEAFAMRATDSDAADAAKEQCKRALDALLGLEALVR